MKTAMQELIDNIDKFGYININGYYDEFIKIEKQQIIDAVEYGFKDANSISPDINFEIYYDKKFR